MKKYIVHKKFKHSIKETLILGLLLCIYFCLSSVSIYSNPTLSSSSRLDILKDHTMSIPQVSSQILTYPFRNPQESTIFLGSTLGLMATDTLTTTFVQNSINPIFTWKYPDLSLLSHVSSTDEYLIFGSLGLYLTSFLMDDSLGQHAALMSFKAMTYSYLYVHLGLKTLLGRHRPDPHLEKNGPAAPYYTKNPWDFGNHHPLYFDAETYGTALPSFHFTLFFSVGKVFERVYDNPWLGYTVTALGLLPEFEGHHHWVSDMFAGAMIGSMIGNEIANHYLTPVQVTSDYVDHSLPPSDDFQFMHAVSLQGLEIAWVKKW